jgi:branched-chain amino acid transport system permease protein
MVTALQFNSGILGPAIVNGLATASLYGVLVISLVLVYRINRSVAFVQGGMATLGGFIYWYLAKDPAMSQFSTKGWPKTPVLLGIVLMGAVLGALFGSVVSNRMANYPRVTVTTFGLGAALLSVGLMGTVWQGTFETGIQGPFTGTFQVAGQFVTYHQLFTLVLLLVVCGALTVVMKTTRAGIYVRAIADDAEAAEIVGIRVAAVGIAVWAVAGALGALAGALIVSLTVLYETALIFVLLRSLAAAVLGGFESFVLGVAGAIVFGLVESTIGGGVFGTVDSGMREIILMGALIGGVMVINRKRLAAGIGGE